MIDLDPLDALALTLHHSPGVQALLLGSGISRPAGIPTGWEITLDLIKRLASVQNVADKHDWAAWYRDRYAREPSYSEILDSVATAPAERRSIIHSYIEARDDEDIRQPTKAHHAIARLVALGAVRVILTTNFDRLLESALRDAGVEPAVIASEDALVGATPLVHSRCTVIKLHGDYMDARIRNTADELERYPPAVDAVLDRVLDEYGLIIAGWSGDWDTALRNAVLRGTSRRYPFYWAVRGSLSPMGTDLLLHRKGRAIAIDDADNFFSQLSNKVDTLSKLGRAHPESIALTVAEGKRLCRDDRFAAEWSDLLAREVDRVSSFVNGPDFPRDSPTNQSINDLVRTTIARSEAIRRLILVGIRWGSEEAFKITLRAISAMAFDGSDSSGVRYPWLTSLSQLSASMAFHWAVAAALLREDFGRASQVMSLPIKSRSEGQRPAVSALPLAALDSVQWKVLEGYEERRTPHSDYFSEIFLNEARDLVVGLDEAEQSWDDSEFLITMEAAHRRSSIVKDSGLWFWVPLGRFYWRRSGQELKDRLNRFSDLPVDSAELQAGLLGGTPQSAKEAAEEVRKFIRENVRFF
ncbi:SIR2 family protein [Mesorhizobium sp. 10J20-29]